jgi:hypothetical protein
VPAGEQPGNFKRIPKGTMDKINKAKVLPTGSSDALVFCAGNVIQFDKSSCHAGERLSKCVQRGGEKM